MYIDVVHWIAKYMQYPFSTDEVKYNEFSLENMLDI